MESRNKKIGCNNQNLTGDLVLSVEIIFTGIALNANVSLMQLLTYIFMRYNKRIFYCFLFAVTDSVQKWNNCNRKQLNATE